MLECLIGMPKKSNILHVNNFLKIQWIINYLKHSFVKQETFICTLYLYMPLKSFQYFVKLVLV